MWKNKMGKLHKCDLLDYMLIIFQLGEETQIYHQMQQTSLLTEGHGATYCAKYLRSRGGSWSIM